MKSFPRGTLSKHSFPPGGVYSFYSFIKNKFGCFKKRFLPLGWMGGEGCVYSFIYEYYFFNLNGLL